MVAIIPCVGFDAAVHKLTMIQWVFLVFVSLSLPSGVPTVPAEVSFMKRGAELADSQHDPYGH